MHQYYEGTQLTCSICSCDFDIELEGGVNGYIGIIPLALCPMCHSGLDVLSPYSELHGCEETEDEDDDTC
jgi:hypothetical protein